MPFLPEDRDARHNFVVGNIQGAVFMFGVAFMDPTTVLPIFVKTFTQSDFVVGLASSLHRAGWHLPQLFVAGYVERKTRRLPVYLWANACRMALLAAFLPILYFYGADHPGTVLTLFVVMYGTSHLFGGVAGLPFSDLVGKTIPRTHWGTFYAVRFFLGHGVMSVIAGLAIREILADEQGYPYPVSFVWIFAFAVALMTAGFLIFGLLREQPGTPSTTRRSAFQMLGEVPRLLEADVNYRRMFVTQMLAAASGLALPFYIVVARERFGVDASTAGIFLMTQTVGVTVSNVVWGWVSTRYGNRAIVRWTLVCQLATPLYALALTLAMGDRLTAAGQTTVQTAFLPIFFLVGATVTGSFVGFKSYLLDIAPEDRRPTYIGITSTMLGVASLFPALGGTLAGWIQHDGVFALTALTLAVGVRVSGRLTDGRDATETRGAHA